MTVALIVMLGVLVGVLSALMAVLVDRRLPVRGRRLVVNLTDGSAIRGILTSSRGPWLVLHEADYLRENAGGPPTIVRADGVVYIDRPRVLFVQVLP